MSAKIAGDLLTKASSKEGTNWQIKLVLTTIKVFFVALASYEQLMEGNKEIKEPSQKKSDLIDLLLDKRKNIEKWLSKFNFRDVKRDLKVN